MSSETADVSKMQLTRITVKRSRVRIGFIGPVCVIHSKNSTAVLHCSQRIYTGIDRQVRTNKVKNVREIKNDEWCGLYGTIACENTAGVCT